MDSWFQLQDRIKKDSKIKEEDKLTDSDMQLMSRDTMIAGMFILVYVYVAIALPFMSSASSQACIYLAKLQEQVIDSDLCILMSLVLICMNLNKNITSNHQKTGVKRFIEQILNPKSLMFDCQFL